jgi:hypothetical protein
MTFIQEIETRTSVQMLKSILCDVMNEGREAIERSRELERSGEAVTNLSESRQKAMMAHLTLEEQGRRSH